VNGANWHSERIGRLLERQLRDGHQIERVSLIWVELGETRSDIGQARQAIKLIHREIGLLDDARYPLDGSLVGAQLADLVPAMTSDEVGGNAEEPRPSVAPSAVITSPGLEGDGEGLGPQILGQISTEPPSDVAVNLGKMSASNLTELSRVALGGLN
jgi:hypothetical protein